MHPHNSISQHGDGVTVEPAGGDDVTRDDQHDLTHPGSPGQTGSKPHGVIDIAASAIVVQPFHGVLHSVKLREYSPARSVGVRPNKVARPSITNN